MPALERYDVAIVGAGVAGASLAVCLARDGRRVLCLERDLRQPDRIVGELLQPGGYQQLCDLGLAEAVDNIDSQKVFGYGIFLDQKQACIDYSEAAAQEAPTGRSFHNGRFVRRLREIAAQQPRLNLVEANVIELSLQDGVVDGVKYKDSKGILHTAYADLTVACDGCFSRLRKDVSPALEYSVTSQFVGLVLEGIALPFPEHGHVVLCDIAPVLFYPISSTEVRCLVDVPSTVDLGSIPGGLTGYLTKQVAPQLPPAFLEPFLLAVGSGKIKTMPNRVMPARPMTLRGAILLGDAFNMRHPLTGGGMTVALSDVNILRRLIREMDNLRDHEKVSTALSSFYESRRALSGTINVLANALYSVFCATKEKSLIEMRSACFDYLARGGRCSNDPISMLGGLRPRPNLLMLHFFGVAVFGCGRALFPFPTIERVSLSWNLLKSAFNIIKPLVDAEGVTLLRWLPFSTIAFP